MPPADVDVKKSAKRILSNEQVSDICSSKRPKPDNDGNSVELAIAYTDGACINNGRKNALGGYGVFWDAGRLDNISEILPSNERHTNIRAEYTAALKAIEQGLANGISRMIIRTDSKLLVSSSNVWIKWWKKNGWKTRENKDVKHRDILEKIDEIKRCQVDVIIEHVRGHSEDYGNKQADKLARRAIRKKMPPIVYISGVEVEVDNLSKPQAGYGIFWCYDKNPGNIYERVPLNERQKDHRALYTAVLKAVNQGITKGFPKMIIRTDSECATKSLNLWVNKWRNNGWRTINDQAVVNSDLLQRIDKLRSKIDFTVEHVTTEHRGIKKAMKLAERGAQNEGRNLKKTGHGGGT